MTARQIRDDLVAEANAGRDRFVRTMILEMYRLTGQMHALAELMTNYIGNPSNPETGEQADAAVEPRSCRASSSAKASLDSVVGAAPAGTAERSPQPIPVSDSAALPSAVPASPPVVESPPAVPPEDKPIAAPAEPTRTERALDLWATTELEPEEIAERVGCKASSIMVFVANARKKADPRAAARDRAREAKIAAMKAEMARPRLIPQAASPLPAPPSPPEPPPTPAVFDAMGIVAIDTKAHIIRGPKGDWHATAPVARTIARINSEGLFDLAVLLQAGPWPGADSFRVHLPSMVRELAKIGVEFIEVKGAGFRIRLAEAS